VSLTVDAVSGTKLAPASGFLLNAEGPAAEPVFMSARRHFAKKSNKKTGFSRAFE
jgi:hypothetical protein